MTDHSRYALYYAPAEGSALARFGASWLGWDNLAGGVAPHPDAPVDVAQVTERPRKYGFHGTMKPPFRLADGATVEAVMGAASALAARTAPFDAPPLTLRALGRFLALVPSGPCPALADLAGACVTELDPFRAPPTETELSKRRNSGLTEAQEDNLMRWGYPYVFKEFRFHLTLTGPLEPDLRDRVHATLAPLTAPLCAAPMPVRDIVLFGEVNGGRFHALHRYALTG